MTSPIGRSLRPMGNHKEKQRRLYTYRPVSNHEGTVVDSIGSVEWEETRHELRELRAPLVYIDGGSRKRGTHICEIQALSGGHFLWQVPMSSTLDLMTHEKIKRIGGNHVTI